MTGTKQFVQGLLRLTSAERSLLRQGAGSLLSRSVQVFDLFTSIYWRLDRCGLDKTPLWLVLTLYPWNSLPDGKGCFGTAWRSARPGNREGQRRHDKRLDAILSAEPPALDALLLDAVRILKRHKVAIDWERFAEDLHKWSDAAAGVRRRWTEDYLTETRQGG